MTAPLVTISRPNRAADALAERLAAVDARHVFGMPGSHTTTLYDAIALRPEIETILVRNEQAGEFMADGYAQPSPANPVTFAPRPDQARPTP